MLDSRSPEEHLESIVREAVELDLPARDALLDQRCGEDPATRARVEAMLKAICEATTEIGAINDTSGSGFDFDFPSSPAKPDPAVVVPVFKRLTDYELLEEIARGGMGVVYKARQISLNRIVALKMILGGSMAAEDDLKRFQAEAEAAANLRHPNIVTIHEVGEEAGQHFFSMDFIEGETLSSRASNGPLPPNEAAELVRKISEAVAFAHKRGIIHRDLKPGNILMNAAGEPIVTDFGLAKRVDVDSNLTQDGRVLGTPSFMPPEQATGNADVIGETTDVYSLGAVFYALLTGRPPFQAATPIDTLRQVIGREPPSPRTLNSDLNKDLETICLKCLNKDPRKRYPSAASLAAELDRYLSGKPIFARPITRRERFRRVCKRNPVVTALTAAVVLVFLVGFAATVSQMLRAQSEARRATEALDNFLRADADRRKANEERQMAYADLDDARRDKAILEAEANQKAARVQELGVIVSELSQKKSDLESVEQKLTGTLDELEQQISDLVKQINAFDREKSKLLTEIVSLEKETDRWRLAAAKSKQEAEQQRVIALQLSGEKDKALARAYAEAAKADLSLWQGYVDRIAATQDVGLAGLVTTAWQALDGSRSQQGIHTSSVNTIAYSPYASHVVTGSSNRATIWNAFGDSVATLGGHYDEVADTAFSPDGTKIATVGGSIKVWNVVGENQRIVEQFVIQKPECTVSCISFSPDGTKLFGGCLFGGVMVWDAKTGEKLLDLKPHGAKITGIVGGPDGKWVVSSSLDRTLKVWDSKTGKELHTLFGHKDGVTSVDVNRDGTRIVSGSNDKTLKLWDPATGREQRSCKGHADRVTSVSFSPGGNWVISGSWDETLKLWKAKSGEEMLTFEGHSGIINDVAFSPDGKSIVSVSRDKTIKKWPAGGNSPSE